MRQAPSDVESGIGINAVVGRHRDPTLERQRHRSWNFNAEYCRCPPQFRYVLAAPHVLTNGWPQPHRRGSSGAQNDTRHPRPRASAFPVAHVIPRRATPPHRSRAAAPFDARQIERPALRVEHPPGLPKRIPHQDRIRRAVVRDRDTTARASPRAPFGLGDGRPDPIESPWTQIARRH